MEYKGPFTSSERECESEFVSERITRSRNAEYKDEIRKSTIHYTAYSKMDSTKTFIGEQ